MKINLVTLCSGYDSQLIAMNMFNAAHAGDENELLAWSEIDEPAIRMHNLIFPEYADRNLGDMTSIDWDKEKVERGWPEVDLLTYSTPCTDISQAGKQAGLSEGSGTRSAILWSTEAAIRSLKPRFLLQENVAALVSKKFMPDFKRWCRVVESYGYYNFLPPIFIREDGSKTKLYCTNAKDCGVPQNRERVYMVSIRADVYEQLQKEHGGFRFVPPKPLETRLEDVLEDEVDEKYFLKDDAVNKFLEANDTSSAVFVQFPLPPTHEDAMFLKTYWHSVMGGIGWEVSPTALEKEVQDRAPRFLEVWQHWKDTGEFPSKGFEDDWNENMKQE